MYLPILRGRQYELLALRECVEKELIGNKIIPIIEPVKMSSTLIKTLTAFVKAAQKIGVVINPQVGLWEKEKRKDSDLLEEYEKLLESNNIIKVYYVVSGLNIADDKAIFIHENADLLEDFMYKGVYNLIPDKAIFRRRIRKKRVLLEDSFNARERNIDYLENGDELFSVNHLYYHDDGYKGFSDYSIVGESYSETGFAPYAVAIHIVYFDEKKNLRVHHFVSDSNDDISDPAGKYSEALRKIILWNETVGMKTYGMKEFERSFSEQRYPGLGVVKKYSIMHHLQLMSEHLEEVSA